MIPSGLGGFMISLLVEDVVRGRVEPDDLGRAHQARIEL